MNGGNKTGNEVKNQRGVIFSPHVYFVWAEVGSVFFTRFEEDFDDGSTNRGTFFFSREYFLVNRVALVFKGIKRTILLSDCIHSFIDFAGCKEGLQRGEKKEKKKKKLAMGLRE